MATLDEMPENCAICGSELEDFQICPQCMLLYIVWANGTLVGANLTDYINGAGVSLYLEN